MCSVGSATGTSTDTCAASSPAHSARSEYVRFAAKDSDSDSDGGDLTVTPNAFELVSRDDVSHC